MACDDSDSEQQRITRRRGACRLCREKKVRCNGRKPCSFCEKHQATCVYPPPTAPKPPAPEPGEMSTSHSAAPGSSSSSLSSSSSQHLPTPASLSNNSMTTNCLTSDHPRESIDINPHLWFETPDFSAFDDGLNFMDFAFGTSTDDINTELLPGLPLLSPRARPLTSTGSAILDNNIHDLTLLPSRQEGDDNYCATNVSDPVDPISLPLGPVVSTASACSLVLSQSPAGAEAPTKKRKTFSHVSSPVLKRRERQRSVLFPTPTSTKNLSINTLTLYNPCESALFPNPRIVGDGFIDSKKNVVNSVAAKLLSKEYLLGLPKAWENYLANDDSQKARHFLENFTTLPMEKLFDSCFNEPRGVNCFLNKFDLLMLLQKHTRREMDEHEAEAEIPIIDVFLLGVIATWGTTPNANEQPVQACAMITQILNLRHDVVQEPDSIVKFLGLVAMLQYASKTGLTQLPTILAEAASVAQSLRLHLETGIHGACPIPASRVYVKRACWVLFCADKVYAMRWRTFSLFPDVEYDLPPLPRDGFHESYPSHNNISPEKDWLIAQCQYARICARISDGFTSVFSTASAEVRKPILPAEPHEPLIHSLLTDLHSWYSSVPREGRSLSISELAASMSSERNITIITAYQYYEAVLAVLSLLSQLSSSPLSSILHLPQLATSSSSTASSAAAILLESLQGVLSFSYHVSDILDDRILLHVPTLALCTLAIEHVNGNPIILSAQRECLALFAMAYGFLGRLSIMLPHDEFFDHVTELFGAVTGS